MPSGLMWWNHSIKSSLRTSSAVYSGYSISNTSGELNRDLNAEALTWIAASSANRVTIIRDYVFFNRLYAIMHDYFRLYAIILLQKLERLYAIISLSHKRRLFHLFHYDYFTYFFRNILLRLLRLYAIMCIMFLSYYYNDYLFPNLLYALCFYQHIICIISIMAIKIIGIMRIIDIIALNLCTPLHVH